MGSYAAAASPHAAIQYDPVTGKIPAFEQRAKRMTQNPFFVPRRTLLVKDVIGATTLASFHLDAGWRQDLCSGCSPVVQLRLFDYDAPMHRMHQDRGETMMRETAWAMQGLLRVNDITVPHLPKRKKTPPMHASYCTPPVCLALFLAPAAAVPVSGLGCRV